MKINENNLNRFEIENVYDPEKKGIDGYHGRIKNYIGKLLEKIFHTTVSFNDGNETYYFNCKSFCNWYGRVVAKSEQIDEATLKANSHNKAWVQQTIDNLSQSSKDKKLSQPSQFRVGQTLRDKDIPFFNSIEQLMVNEQAKEIFRSLFDATLFNEEEKRRINEILDPFFKLTSQQDSERLYIYITNVKKPNQQVQPAFKETGCLFTDDYNEKKLSFTTDFLKNFTTATHQNRKQILLNFVLPQMERAVEAKK